MNSLLTSHVAVASPAPDPAWIVGACPSCRGALVNNTYYVGGSGYRVVTQCWEALGEHPTCTVFDLAKYQGQREQETNVNIYDAPKTILIPTPELSDNQREAFAICDFLSSYISDDFGRNSFALTWFRKQIQMGHASFCPICHHPNLGAFCMTCLMLPECREALDGNLDFEMLASHMKDQHTQRELACSQLDMIRSCRELAEAGTGAADYVIYSKAAMAAQESVVHSMEREAA